MTHSLASELTVPEIFLRLAVAYLAGFVVGWERESRGRPAGLRTNIFACTAAAAAMVISQMLFADAAADNPNASWRPDPARLGAGILTGIGFLGAGTIIRHENYVIGVTTAASLWFVTVLGLAFGSGQYLVGAIGLAIALLTLFLLPALEKYIHSECYAMLTVTAAHDTLPEDRLKSKIEALGPAVLSMKLCYDLEKKLNTVTCELKLDRPQRFELARKVASELAQAPGVLQVKWE